MQHNSHAVLRIVGTTAALLLGNEVLTDAMRVDADANSLYQAHGAVSNVNDRDHDNSSNIV